MIKKIIFGCILSMTIPGFASGQNVIIRGQAAGVTIAGEEKDSSKVIIEAIDLDSFFFLLGTLSDYMGRSIKESEEDYVDRYLLGEEPLYEFLMTYLEGITKSPLTLDTIGKKRVSIRSENLAERIRPFYQLIHEGRSSKDGKIWEKRRNYKLKEDIFDNKLQKQSFLTGVILRHGQEIHPDIYKLSLNNSISLEKKIIQLLYELGCTKLFFERKTNRIPVSFTIYFKVPSSLESAMMNYDELFSDLYEFRKNFYVENVGVDIFAFTNDLERCLIEEWKE